MQSGDRERNNVPGTLLVFIAGTCFTWTSPELAYLNSTDTGPFNGTLTEKEASWIGGFLSLGAILGPFVAGYLADKIGRKYTILAISVPFFLSSILLAFSKTVLEFYVARFIAGLCVGASFTIVPMYVGEMSKDQHRGVLGSIINVSICSGLLFSYIVGSYIENVTVFNSLLAGLSAAVFVLFWFLGYETPHWYISKNKYKLAKQTLLKIGNASDEAVEKELQHIKSVIESEKQGNIFDIFRSKGSTKAFIMGSGLVFLQQASGINAILFFAQSIFQKTGTSLKPNYCSMVIGAVQFGTSFIAPLLTSLFGRRILLVSSSIGMFIFESLLGIYGIIEDNDPDIVKSFTFMPILLLVSYIIAYNVGFGPLPWAIMGEIFSPKIKASASALAISVCWLTSFIITTWFSQIVDTVGQGGCFMGFAVASLVAVAFSHFCVIETKGKTLVEIQEDFNK